MKGDKIGLAMRIPHEISNVFHTPDDLNMDKIHKALQKSGHPNLPLEDPSHTFAHVLKLNTAMFLEMFGAPADSSLVKMTSEHFTIFTKRHLSKLPELNNNYGQRLIKYGGKEKFKSLKEIVKWAHENNCIVLKNMVHVTKFPGGAPQDAFKGESIQNGITHGGILFLDNKTGEIVWYDYPYGYGQMVEKDYWAYVILFDPSTIEYDNEAPSHEVENAYFENSRTWAALTMIAVEFADDYKNDPLQIKKSGDLREFADLVLLNKITELQSYEQYCQEGVWNLINLGRNIPLNQQSVIDELISQEAYDYFLKMLEIFNNADGEQDPNKGWDALYDHGYISNYQLEKITETKVYNMKIQKSPDSLRPWTYYNPTKVLCNQADKDKDGFGLIGVPSTLAGIVRNFVHTNFPHNELSSKITDQLNKVLDSGDGHAMNILNSIIVQLSSNRLAADRFGTNIMGKVFSSLFQASIIDKKELKDEFMKKYHVNDMDEPSKAAYKALYQEFINALKDPFNAIDSNLLNKKLDELDKKAREMVVTINGKETRFIQFISPQTIVDWCNELPGCNSVGFKHLGMLVHSEYFA